MDEGIEKNWLTLIKCFREVTELLILSQHSENIKGSLWTEFLSVCRNIQVSSMKIYSIFYFCLIISNIVANDNNVNYENIIKAGSDQEWIKNGGMLRSLRSEAPLVNIGDLGRKRVLRSLNLGHPVSLISIIGDRITRSALPQPKTGRIDPWMEGIIIATK